MSEIKQHAERIVRKLRDEGYQAFLVGGCVRDLLLGREPSDYDVTTSATPDDVIRILPQTYAVGAQFGVVLVPTKITALADVDSRINKGSAGAKKFEGEADHAEGGECNLVEVATFRIDIGYSDGRHPDQVRFSNSAQEDVERRDFTINGLLLDPMNGNVLDYVGGQGDLKAKIIRTIGNPEWRFAEDKLRMLRAVRFAARFGFTIEPATMAAIRRLAPQLSPEAHQVSGERVRDELTKMLTEGQAHEAFRLLDECGLLAEVLPQISAMKGVQQPPQFHPEGDVFVHTLLLLEKLPHPCPASLAWGALLHDVGKPATFRMAPDRIRFDGHVAVGVKMAEEICRRLRFSNDDTEQILALIDNHMRFSNVPQMKDSTFKRFVRQPRFEEHLELHRLDCLASHGDLGSYQFTRERIASIPPEAIRPAPLVSGDDLIAAGYKPGPRFKQMLSLVEDAQLEGRLSSKESAMGYVKEQFPLSSR
jgi:poly(A) polymerase